MSETGTEGLAASIPDAGETWVSRHHPSRLPEYIVLAVAMHTNRMEAPGGLVERLVIYRAARGQDDDPSRVWATPLSAFVRDFILEPRPAYPE